VPLDTPRLPKQSALSEASERAVGRVVELARGWVREQPERVLEVVERQARQVMVQQQEISDYQQHVSQLQKKSPDYKRHLPAVQRRLRLPPRSAKQNENDRGVRWGMVESGDERL
jgi:hypothetical protein